MAWCSRRMASAYVALEGRGRVLRLDPTSGAELASVDTGPNTRHLAINADGTRLYVSRFVTPRLPGEHTADVVTKQGGAPVGGEVIVLDAASFGTLGTIVLRHDDDMDSENVRQRRAELPRRAGDVARWQLGMGAIEEGQHQARHAAQRRQPEPPEHGARHRLAHRPGDQRRELRRAGRPRQREPGQRGRLRPVWRALFVALETSREVAVVDAHNGWEFFRFGVGRAPQGLAVSADGRRLYVSNFMDRTVERPRPDQTR